LTKNPACDISDYQSERPKYIRQNIFQVDLYSIVKEP